MMMTDIREVIRNTPNEYDMEAFRRACLENPEHTLRVFKEVRYLLRLAGITWSHGDVRR